MASLWPRAAEIIRYTYDGWAASDIATFENMLKKVYLPELVNGSSSNGNWELSMIEATIGIGVFIDDQATFDKAVAMWKKRVPAYGADGAGIRQRPVDELAVKLVRRRQTLLLERVQVDALNPRRLRRVRRCG